MCIRERYNASTGVISYTIPTTIASLSNHDTDDVAEGATNKYYLDERVDDRINALIIAGTGVTKSYDDAANTYTLSVTQADVNTDIVTEGSTNLFTTAARTRTHFTYGTGITHSSGTLSVTQSDINTDNVTDGSTNLFTTAARTRTHFTYGTGITHDGSGGLSVTQADIDTDNITEGSTNIFFTNARADARVVAGITGKLDASAISTFGLTLVDDASASAARTTLGLGTAATTASTAYATAAQGTLAASAIQSSDLATVATSGAYNDLSGKPTLFSGAYADLSGTPTLGTAAAAATGDFATAAQGSLAASALQAETITLAQLKTAAATSANYAAFQAAIAAL